MDYSRLKNWHQMHKEAALYGRYINHGSITPLIKELPNEFTVEQLGVSVQKRPIEVVTWGEGSVKILAWSQMHGNESTTTKAVFDLFKWLHLNKNDNQVKQLHNSLSLKIVPMLNPDGAEVYTRINANKVDLNRDAQDRSQPESQILHNLYSEFKPDLCLNLHGQRTIFGVGNPAKSATVSFLSPSQDELRTVTQSRKKGMAIIANLAQMLEDFIPGQVGRYDDGFNLNCVGDTLQHLNIPTILFEAGHFKEDYDREETRAFMFLSLLGVLESVALQDWDKNPDYRPYFSIPENSKCFFDIIFRNLNYPNRGLFDLAVQYEEQLKNTAVHFVPKISQIADLECYFGHKEYNCKGSEAVFSSNFELKEGVILEEFKVKGDLSTTFSLKS
ncbi:MULTISPECIES: M14 family zinc carboxypeptidase [unclassified Leeuwenhoekiella]|uniref:M14 family zinc carboxypeptidase n=1 Tax=unclassified Leeuwenhoekiella TaxID=2615029 RepID=UPI000C3BCD40|nr:MULTISPECIES: M14 family zinc carboxypeptidase [unclassified Leeuwenhoekiella]MAW95252.1 peptidase M14 [Leeuwenhoekiella sp.]MBA81825.1 peptidase M14 [Leeuwenhoekiella sp.]|tara:strand:- start:7778 stop:8941 length:1164 start_codon:yes stop_codon:yes gene_type:complete